MLQRTLSGRDCERTAAHLVNRWKVLHMDIGAAPSSFPENHEWIIQTFALRTFHYLNGCLVLSGGIDISGRCDVRSPLVSQCVRDDSILVNMGRCGWWPLLNTDLDLWPVNFQNCMLVNFDQWIFSKDWIADTAFSAFKQQLSNPHRSDLPYELISVDLVGYGADAAFRKTSCLFSINSVRLEATHEHCSLSKNFWVW
jgi:hypothetical protein